MTIMEECIINIKALDSNKVHVIPASSEEHQAIMKLLINRFDSFIKNNKEEETKSKELLDKLCRYLKKDKEEETEYKEQFEKSFRFCLKYCLEIQNKERGIKAFTLNDSIFFTIALLNSFEFQYLTITDIAKVCNVFFDYDTEKIRKGIQKIRKEKREQSDFNLKVNQQINGIVKKVEHLLGAGSNNQAKLKEMKEWLHANIMSKNNLWNEHAKE